MSLRRLCSTRPAEPSELDASEHQESQKRRGRPRKQKEGDSSAAEQGSGLPTAPTDGQMATPKKRHFTPEHRQKLSEARKVMLERRGGFPEEWRRAMSEGASRRRWGLDVRYRMSRSQEGRKVSPQTRENMAAAQQRRRERERRERLASGASAGAGAGVLRQAAYPGAMAGQQQQQHQQQQQQLSEELAREKAVIELSRLRQVVFGWMDDFEAVHGHKPSMHEAQKINPDIYRAFVRYVGLRELLRGGGTVEPSSAAGGPAARQEGSAGTGGSAGRAAQPGGRGDSGGGGAGLPAR